MQDTAAAYPLGDFLFAPRYRLLRHVLFWLVHIIVFSFIFRSGIKNSVPELILGSTLWVPAFILYCYPVMYYFLPRFLLNGRYTAFALIMAGWAVSGWFFNYLYRTHILFPVADLRHWDGLSRNPWATGSYLTMNTMMGMGCTIVLFKYWTKKQQDWMRSEKEKVDAELQLLKAQVHPHFLFNTLNNIYAYALKQSPRTADLVLKLSSLLSYMLYDCKGNLVSLAKELSVMQDYMDLEQERYGKRIDISTNIEGDIRDKHIVPLLLLPFLENAFKHGTSEQLVKPWLGFDLQVRDMEMKCKIVNSKNPQAVYSEQGIGINNVRKRLELLYPGRHALKISSEDDFFVVSLSLTLDHSGMPVEPDARAVTGRPHTMQ